jgi:uncharacterized protein YodC (DUF2158 family)
MATTYTDQDVQVALDDLHHAAVRQKDERWVEIAAIVRQLHSRCSPASPAQPASGPEPADLPADAWKPGDVVVLTGGGPRMTVILPAYGCGDRSVTVAWFAGDELQQEDFDTRCLRPPSPADAIAF